ncbi:MAG TPA: hypothetical protein VFR07_06415 [Mycobacteriales bacterium]|jgi:hypothetical protein|nr:hypothetical protein [Mycobacteriales bacterium]
MTSTREFFDRYAAALLARTEAGVAASWTQYDGVESIDKTISVMKEGPGTVSGDVTWFYGNARERFCYQLVERAQDWQIAVLTFLA